MENSKIQTSCVNDESEWNEGETWWLNPTKILQIPTRTLPWKPMTFLSHIKSRTNDDRLVLPSHDWVVYRFGSLLGSVGHKVWSHLYTNGQLMSGPYYVFGVQPPVVNDFLPVRVFQNTVLCTSFYLFTDFSDHRRFSVTFNCFYYHI